MSIVVTRVLEDQILMAADTGFSDDCSRWSNVHMPKFVIHRTFAGTDIVVGITGSAKQLSLMNAFLHKLDTKMYEVEGTNLGVFTFMKKWSAFCDKLDVGSNPQADGYLSELHIVTQGTAWTAQGYFISQITEWETMGSGDPYARAAMRLGHNLIEAAEVASMYDLYCEPPIMSLTYDVATRCVVESVTHDSFL